MRKDTVNWIALADYDIETAQHMLATGRYLYVIFLCHLALEKLLKAHVAEATQTVPIKTHDLIYLVKKCELEIPENHLDFIGKMKGINLGASPEPFLPQQAAGYGTRKGNQHRQHSYALPGRLTARVERISKIGC